MRKILGIFGVMLGIAIAICPTQSFSMARQPRGQKTNVASNPTPLPEPSSRDMQISTGEIEPAGQKTNE